MLKNTRVCFRNTHLTIEYLPDYQCLISTWQGKVTFEQALSLLTATLHHLKESGVQQYIADIRQFEAMTAAQEQYLQETYRDLLIEAGVHTLVILMSTETYNSLIVKRIMISKDQLQIYHVDKPEKAQEIMRLNKVSGCAQE